MPFRHSLAPDLDPPVIGRQWLQSRNGLPWTNADNLDAADRNTMALRKVPPGRFGAALRQYFVYCHGAAGIRVSGNQHTRLRRLPHGGSEIVEHCHRPWW